MSQDNSYRPPTSFGGIPQTILYLLIINGLVYFAQKTPFVGEMLIEWCALWSLGAPDGYASFWPWQLLTYGFMHSPSDFMHILFNMFMLWMFGTRLEYVWGPRRFLTFYIVCIVGAGLVQLLVGVLTNSYYPTLGASGGVMGILLAFGMLFPEEKLYLYFLVPVKAKFLVAGLAVLELFFGVTGGQPGVANFAHLGGMLFGFLMIMYWRGKLPVQPKRRVMY